MYSYERKNEKRLLTLVYSVAVAALILVLSVPLPGYAAQARQKSFDSPGEAVKPWGVRVKPPTRRHLRASSAPQGKMSFPREM
jgi:hypothetical protein